MKTASALKLHILFFVLCGFALRLPLLLSRIVLQSLGYGVLRFGLLLNRLLRRKDFADPIANIFHRLQFLSDGYKLPGKLGMGAFQAIVFCLQSIEIDVQINALFFQITERFVEAVQLVPVAFRKGGLPCFPADFQILVMDCLVCPAIGNGSLNARNDLHPFLGFLNLCADCLGFSFTPCRAASKSSSVKSSCSCK